VRDRTLLFSFSVADGLTRFASVPVEQLHAEMDWSQ
jgi:hypothetical protein